MTLYATTIFLSAFLLFQVQPLIAKVILPWFGGSAAVWTTCMLFFQILLLGGYIYAHALTRIRKAGTQRLVHVGLLAACLLLLPLAPSADWKPAGGDDPTWRILALLAGSVGLPYFALSTTGPLVQAWYARSHTGAMPYRLFALSNLGSLLALFSYPLVVEPLLALRWQTGVWSAGFTLFALLCATLAWKTPAGAGHGEAAAGADVPAPGLLLNAWWAALACCASALLLAFTSHLSLNVAPIPFMWVLPLVLYLLSFILCFEVPHWYRRDLFIPVLIAGLGGVCYTLMSGHQHPQLVVLVPLYAVTLFCACMVCHGELARSKPHPRHLTGFYLQLALGGALGGLFVGLVAPHVFTGLYELPVGLGALGILVFAALYRDRASPLHGRFGAAAQFMLAALVAGMIGFLAWAYDASTSGARLSVRNFYAMLTVEDSGSDEDASRALKHGTIQHGSQFLDASRRNWPTTYYGPQSGVALAVEAAGNGGPRHVAVVGLGVGTLASYGRKGDVFRFYELNPQVVELARKEFSFLGDSAATIELSLGDARLSLERETARRFDVIALDAFSSDSIPVHLLTLEAFRIYVARLKPEGVLAIHVSNRYLDLVPVVAEAARVLSLHTTRVSSEDDYDNGVFSSDWILLSLSAKALQAESIKSTASPVEPKAGTRAWTDDYSDLLHILK